MNWLHYLLEANLYLAVAYSCYWLLFRKQTFYTANRIYLLVSTVLCFVIPLVQVGRYEPQKAVVQAPQTVQIVSYDAEPSASPVPSRAFLTPNKAAQAIYWLVASSMCVWLIIKLYSLLKLVFTSKRKLKGGHTLVYVNKGATPFSFFGYLFVKESEPLAEVMLRHELVHIRQKHSWDIMFIEVLKIMNWFNPVIYLLQNSLKALHEFEADRCAIANKKLQDNYVNSLIAQAYHSNGLPFAHHFSNQQLLKSRIMKLYQKRSGKLDRLNYLMAVPLCAGLLCASSLAFSKDYGWIKLNWSKPMATEKGMLLVKSNGFSNTARELKIVENDGLLHAYRANTISSKDIVRLKDDYQVYVKVLNDAHATPSILTIRKHVYKSAKSSKSTIVETQAVTQDTKSAKTNDIPPPPPPSALKSSRTNNIPPPPPPSARKLPKTNNIPPPPPPNAMHFPLPKKAAKTLKAGDIEFPPPRVYNESGKEVDPLNHKISDTNPDTVKKLSGNPTKFSLNRDKFGELTEHIAKHFIYPATAIAHKTAGYTMVAFKINNDHTMSNIRLAESLSPETDKELVKCFNSYTKTINAKPRDYTMGFILAIEGPVLKDSAGQIKSLGGINFGTKKRTGHEMQPNTLTMLLRGKEVQMRVSKIKIPQLKVGAASAQKSFIELETIRFKNIASLTKHTSPGCYFHA